jgi:hypothetical protein
MRSTMLLSTAITLLLTIALAGASGQQPSQPQPAQPQPAQPQPAQPAALPTQPPAAQPQPAVAAPAAFPWEGEITGSNVYIRSGAGVNWYPTAKLNAGDRVLVLSEKFGWYQIAPPKGSFSFVDKAMVDKQADGKTGIIKQNKVYVQAGSELEDRKSATQMVLDKDAKVDIIGEAEGFFKIAPPKGASLYVTKAYVEPVAQRMRTGLAEQHTDAVAAKPPADAAPTATAPADGRTPILDAAAAGQDAGAPLEGEPTIEALQQNIPGGPNQPAVAGKTPSGAKSPKTGAAKPADRPKAPEPPAKPRYEVMLNQLENLLQAELKRPAKEQDITSIMNRYEEIAAQKDEDIPARIAKIRIQQLRDWQALVSARGESVTSVAALEDFRSQLQQKRKEIEQRRIEQAVVKYDLEGELRKSYAFSTQQRRYRLVDPARGTTIAYVDVPPTVGVNVENLIGRMVGIRASEKQFSPSARVPIAVAKDVVDLSPRNLPAALPADSENTQPPPDKSDTEHAPAPTGEQVPAKP